MQHKLNGFSIVELAITLSVIILIGIWSYVKGGEVLNTGKYNAAKSDISAISLAVSQYKFEIGSWPATLAELTQANGQYGPWLSESSTDPWGNNYNYTYISAQRKFAVWSNGPDGKNNSGDSPTVFSGDDIGISGH